MNNLKAIRERLHLTQEGLAKGIGCTQANVGHIESGRQNLLPSLAGRIIAFAATLGVALTFDDVYAKPDESSLPASEHPALEG